MGNVQKKGAGSGGGPGAGRGGENGGPHGGPHTTTRAGPGNPGSSSEEKKVLPNGTSGADPERDREHDRSGMNLDAPAGALPPALGRLKNEGNLLFKNGQFGEALLKYTQAIDGYTGTGNGTGTASGSLSDQSTIIRSFRSVL